ncbi:MAG: hypothetical protein CM1200mP3_17290 [Chloroflexota bacterium]|nr:MAG: hypothetical protein CM1200mP3_17290 [Chloroflexota bacterium]
MEQERLKKVNAKNVAAAEQQRNSARKALNELLKPAKTQRQCGLQHVCERKRAIRLTKFT